VGAALEADQLAAVVAQAEEACDRLRDALDGYTPFPAPLAGVDHAAIGAKIEQALADDQAVEIVYHTAGRGERTTRVVEPLRLEEHRGAVYLIAYCRLRQAERVFRMDRIESATVTD
jgi:proteasome accessory factor C